MLQKISLPYGQKSVELSIESNNIAGILRLPKPADSTKINEKDIVIKALAEPIGSPPLYRLAQNKQKVVIITSDHTRAVPSKITLPLLLAEIRRGNPHADITVVIATGLHRGMTPEEMRARFGEELFEKERFVNHNAYDTASLTKLGTLPSGSKCEVNTLALNADLLIAEGFIEPHFFAGCVSGNRFTSLRQHQSQCKGYCRSKVYYRRFGRESDSRRHDQSRSNGKSHFYSQCTAQ